MAHHRHASSHPPRDTLNVKGVTQAAWRRGRQHYRKDGSEKKAFDSLEEAQAAAKVEMAQLAAKGFSITLQSYQCPYCWLWHRGRPIRHRWMSWERRPIRHDEALLAELGERVFGCMREENHGERRKREGFLRGVTGAVIRRRLTS